MFKEFKEFIARGNVVDMAIGLVMGSAFTAIVNAVVDNILMPIISGLTAGVNHEDIVLTIGGSTLKIGLVINAIISFLIISLFMFFVVKAINAMRRDKDEVEEAPTTKTCQYCHSEIPVDAVRCPHCTSKLEGYANPLE